MNSSEHKKGYKMTSESNMESRTNLTGAEVSALPTPIFLRWCMDKLKFHTTKGEFDYERAARFFGIRYELFYGMASGSIPMLRRERDKVKKKVDIATGDREIKKRDARTEADIRNARIGRFLRSLREKFYLAGVSGVTRNQSEIAALMDVSVGAVQAWEYGRTRIPNIRMDQYLQIVGASDEQKTKAWVMLEEMPDVIICGLASDDETVKKCWDALMEACEEHQRKVANPDPEKPTFATHREEQAWIEERKTSDADARKASI